MSLLVMVEIPRGSRNKYEYDCEQQRFYLDRMLFSSVHYPTDYGLFQNTGRRRRRPRRIGNRGRSDLSRLLHSGGAGGGVSRCGTRKGRIKKILCVPVSDPPSGTGYSGWMMSRTTCSKKLLTFSKFTRIWKKKETKVGGDWLGKEEALKIVAEAQVRYAQAQ